MGKLIDLTGQRFGKLTVLKRGKDKNKRASWICQCDCGEIKEIRGDNLRNGISKSCGCEKKGISGIKKDLSGKKFGKLTVIKYSHTEEGGQSFWECECECGNKIIVRGSQLVRKKTQSCGCLKSSLGELNIENILKENNIVFQKEKIFDDLKKLRFDFYLPEHNRLIEFDGEQHFHITHGWNDEKQFEALKERDKIKNDYALSHNISLVRIPYWERDNITLELLFNNKYLIN